MKPIIPPGGWTRREFLTALGAAGVAPAAWVQAEELAGVPAHPAAAIAAPPRLRVVRPQDLLSFELELLNLEVVHSAASELRIASHGASGFIVLHFTGQHIAEQALWDRGGQRNSDGSPVDNPEEQKKKGEPKAPLTYRMRRVPTEHTPAANAATDPDDTDLAFLKRGVEKTPRIGDLSMLQGLAGAWLSGPSQLVFELPQRLTPLPFDLDEILRLCAQELELVVAPGVSALTAAENNQARAAFNFDGLTEAVLPHHAGGLHDNLGSPYSIVEFPSLLNLSPYRTARWRLRPSVADGRAELWGLQLESPQEGGFIGKPRLVRPRGHLFAFGWRSVDEARWPLPLQDGVKPDQTHKYSPSERPKTSLYEATRKLLVSQLLDDNGDIVAERFRLSALGATARLHYNPVLDAPTEQNLEGVKPRDDQAVLDEGTLSEWQQKTEAGRDFYSKEAFTGYWMPFGYKAEVVTITERLLCTENDAPVPRTSILKKDPSKEDERLIDLHEDEAQLTAFLVARKYARIRGSRLRQFSETEPADFTPLSGEAGRAIGLKSVEVLVERTPILANQHAVSKNLAEELAAMDRGDDAIVDGGDGKDAAREIFWPRIADAALDADGHPTRKLVIYKFPVRFTFLDGSTRTTEIPMLFVPTLAVGERLYPAARADLRQAAIGAAMPVVQPPPPAAIAPSEVGKADEIGKAAESLKAFLPKEVHVIFEHEHSAGTSAVLADSLNLVLGKLPAEITRCVTQVTEAITSEVNANNFDTLLATAIRAGRTKLDDEGVATIAKGIQNDIERAIAWGQNLIEPVDPIFAAERLTALLKQLAAKAAEAAGTLKDFTEKLGKKLSEIKELPAQVRADFDSDFAALIAKLPKNADADAADFLKAVRQFAIHWAVGLAGIWRRDLWDKDFHDFAVEVDRLITGKETLIVETRIATVQKELQQALLRGADAIEIADRKVNQPLLPATVLPVVVAEIKGAVEAVLDPLEKAVRQNADGVARLLAGLEAAVGHERALLERTRALLQDYATLPIEALKERTDRVLLDARTHLQFVLTHYQDGRNRWEQFLEHAFSTRELIREARAASLPVLANAQQEISNKVTTALRKATARMEESVRRLLMSANPEQLLRRFEDVAGLTGGKLRQALTEEISRVQARALQILKVLKGAAGPGASASATATVRQGLEELFSLARDLVSKYRQMLERLLITAGDSMRAAVEGLIGQVAGDQRLLQRYVAFASDRPSHVAWTLGAAARDLITDVSRVLASAEAAASAAENQAAKDLRDAATAIDRELKDELAVTLDTMRTARARLLAVAGRLEPDLRRRVESLEKVVASWLLEDVLEPAKRREQLLERRAEDLLEHLVALLWPVLAHAEAEFNTLLEALLAGLAEDKFKELLTTHFPAARAAAEEIRRLTGEVEDIGARIAQLPEAVGNTARNLLKDKLEPAVQKFVENFAGGLQARLQHAEGDVLAMAKRAVVSLPVPSLVREFQDQTRKAVFHAEQALFSVQTLGQGVQSFLAHPRLENLNVRIPHVDAPQAIQYAKDYLEHGLESVTRAKNEVFADIVGAAQTAAQNSGIANVAAQVHHLSREVGNLAAGAKRELAKVEDEARDALKTLRENAEGFKKKAEDLANQQLDTLAEELIPGGLKLFNILPLDQIIKTIKSPGELPKMLEHRLPDRIERTFAFAKEAKPLSLAIVSFNPVEGCQFRIDSRATVWVPAPGRAVRPPSFSVRGQLDAFSAEISGLLRINFASLTFVAENGNFQCVPKLGKVPARGGGKMEGDSVVEFLGPLAFVDNLRKTIGKLLGDKGLVLGVEDETIFAGLRLRLPDVTLGAVAITNLALNMRLGLPLAKGPLRYRFALSDRIETFRVAVTIFAGGGFFALELASQPEFCKVEGAIEFGGSLSLSVGFASGSVSVMAGIYFSWSGVSTILDAYVRVCGNITVLGFIEVSIVIYLALGYRKEGNQSQLHGEASITISVKIGFFSKSFSLSYEKTIAGSETSAALGLPERWDAAARRRLASGSHSRRLTAGAAPEAAADKPAPAPVAPRFTEAMNEDQFVTYWKAFNSKLPVGCGKLEPGGNPWLWPRDSHQSPPTPEVPVTPPPKKPKPPRIP